MRPLPVELTRPEKVLLVDVIGAWSSHEGMSGTAEGLPAGILELRNALLDDLDDVPE